MTCQDCHPAFVAGLELGRAEHIDFEIVDQVQERIHDRVRESLGLARLSARHGEAFSQLVRESGERE